jgi:hypothetical protein
MPFTIRPFLRFLVNRFLAMQLAYVLGWDTDHTPMLSRGPVYAEGWRLRNNTNHQDD